VTVGLTEPEAVKKFGAQDIKVYTSDFINLYYGSFFKGGPGDKPVTKYKLICQGPSEKVVGLHMIGEAQHKLSRLSHMQNPNLTCGTRIYYKSYMSICMYVNVLSFLILRQKIKSLLIHTHTHTLHTYPIYPMYLINCNKVLKLKVVLRCLKTFLLLLTGMGSDEVLQGFGKQSVPRTFLCNSD